MRTCRHPVFGVVPRRVDEPGRRGDGACERPSGGGTDLPKVSRSRARAVSQAAASAMRFVLLALAAGGGRHYGRYQCSLHEYKYAVQGHAHSCKGTLGPISWKEAIGLVRCNGLIGRAGWTNPSATLPDSQGDQSQFPRFCNSFRDFHASTVHLRFMYGSSTPAKRGVGN